MKRSDNVDLHQDYKRLQEVPLNPRRHSAPNAFEHCELVHARIAMLAVINGCSGDEIALLEDLALVHDIGKLGGTPLPSASVEMLARYGSFPESFVNLVRYHDVSLPWYKSSRKGQPPGESAWKHLAGAVDLRLLCLFMIADRIDCPGGWQANAPTVWFLDECRRRGLLPQELITAETGEEASSCCEHSAGAVLVRRDGDSVRILLARFRPDVYELPKGHVEEGEPASAATVRKLREETGLLSPVEVKEKIGCLQYRLPGRNPPRDKMVDCFLLVTQAPPIFGPPPTRLRELRWVDKEELPTIPLVGENLRRLLENGFAMAKLR